MIGYNTYVCLLLMAAFALMLWGIAIILEAEKKEEKRIRRKRQMERRIRDRMSKNQYWDHEE